LYEDAIYIHEGLKFIVRVVNLSQCSPPLMVRVEPVTGINWITEPRDITRLMPGKTQMAVCLGNDSAHCNFGLLTIATTLRGYKKLDQKTRRLLAIHELPPTTHEQTHEGLWIEGKSNCKSARRFS
jgi:hypothetical protein